MTGDISKNNERLQVEMKRIPSDKELQAVYDGLLDGLLIANARTQRFIKTNSAMCILLGYTEEELLSLSVKDIHPPSVLEDINTKFREAAQGRLQKAENTLLLKKNGERLWVDVGIGRLNYMGHPCLVGLFHDITERKKADETLLENEQYMQMALSVSNSYSFSWDIQSDRIWRSTSAVEVLGLPADKAIADSSDNFFRKVHPDDRENLKSKLRNLKQSDGTIKLQYRVKHTDAQPRVMEKTAKGIFDRDGCLLQVVGISTDITEKKQMEEVLKRSHEELERRVQERTHDLAEAIRKQNEYSDQLRKMAEDLTNAEQRERQRLSKVLHDGLQQHLVAAIYQIELLQGNQDTQKDLDQLRQLLEESIETARMLAAELSPPILLRGDLFAALQWLMDWMRDKHGLKVTLKGGENIRPLREGILLPFFEITRELLFNVIKHSGVKEARVELVQNDRYILLTVTDDGSGFDSDRLNLTTNHTSGSGLFQIHERITLMGGKIDYCSKPGEGCQFHVFLPLSNETAEAASGSDISVTSTETTDFTEIKKDDGKVVMKINILLADDHIVARQGLASLITREPDLEIIGEAANGKEAVDMARDIHPDVILMDVNMPQMDGIEATRIIHSEDDRIRIIGFSMYQEESLKKAMLDAGATAYLTKQGSSRDLIDAIRSSFKKK